MKVGFIGLGTMGLPITMNLIEAGHEVYVFSRSRGSIEQAVNMGAIECATPADLARKVEVAFTCLPMPSDIEQVYLHEEGLLEGSSPGKVFVDLSTVGPDLSRKLHTLCKVCGTGFIDAPVSGGPMGAKAGTLTIMCGGELEVFEQIHSLLETIGQKVLLMGQPGSGSIAKLINNQLFGIHTVALAEAMMLAQKARIDMEKIYTVLKTSTGNSAILDWVYPGIMEHRFSPKFKVDLLLKDMEISGKVGEEAGIDMPVAKTARTLVKRTSELGYGGLDISSVICPYEK